MVEQMDSPLLPKEVDEHTRAILTDAIRPAVLYDKGEHGSFLCKAVTLHAGGLFTAEFGVAPGDVVEMIKDEPITADLKGGSTSNKVSGGLYVWREAGYAQMSVSSPCAVSRDRGGKTIRLWRGAAC
jgi:hypothetical protein